VGTAGELGRSNGEIYMKIKSIIPLLAFSSMLSGCGILREMPLSSHNGNYIRGLQIEQGKPYSIEVGGEKILVKTTYETENHDIKRVDKYYRYVDGKLQQIEVADLKTK